MISFYNTIAMLVNKIILTAIFQRTVLDMTTYMYSVLGTLFKTIDYLFFELFTRNLIVYVQFSCC